jgi:hypothetical protein
MAFIGRYDVAADISAPPEALRNETTIYSPLVPSQLMFDAACDRSVSFIFSTARTIADWACEPRLAKASGTLKSLS